MFKDLDAICTRPDVFGVNTAEALWADAHRAEQMLAFHLNANLDKSSRKLDFIETSAAWITAHFDLSDGKHVCDFGCGPGLYTSRFAASGAQVTGVDFSANSIVYARSQADADGLDITYVQTNYLQFEPHQEFNLITMIMRDFCALSPEQRHHFLTLFHACLKPDGAILLDVYSLAGFKQRAEASYIEKNQLNHFWSKDAYYCVVNTFKYEEDAVALDKYDIFPASGPSETVYNWLQYFSPESLTREFEKAGFRVEAVLNDVAGTPYDPDATEFAVIARTQS